MSKGLAGSRLDRHANIGEGNIGSAGFSRLLRHPKLRTKPFILETPVDVERSCGLETRSARQYWRGQYRFSRFQSSPSASETANQALHSRNASRCRKVLRARDSIGTPILARAISVQQVSVVSFGI